jgi:putative transposase
VIARHGRWGFWKCFHWMRQRGEPWNHKRVHRVYRLMRLNLPRRTKRRVPARERQPLVVPPEVRRGICVATRVQVPPVELDGSRPKAMSGMKP